MKIAYVTSGDPHDVHAWSGLARQIGVALEPHAEVHYAGPLPYRRFLGPKVWQLLCEATSHKIHKRGREPKLLKYYAAHALAKVRSIRPDVVFASSSLPIAYLECEQPLVMWIDSTFAGLLDYYPEFSHLCRHVIDTGNAAEQHALDRCRRVIFSSEWAAREAQRHYRLSPAKIAVVPFGSNIDPAPRREDVQAAIRQRCTCACHLFFVGVDWQRKGADLAIAVTEGLRNAGIPAELTIVGCPPPAGTTVPENVTLAGFISKSTEEGRAQFARLYEQAHFLLFPSRAECYGVVVAEANAFGVPVVASDTGGITTPVRPGRNGICWPLDQYVSRSVAYIAEHWSDRQRYQALAEASRDEFDLRLNWSVSGKIVADLLRVCTSQ
jgi:glycosyltransferase involved in cell wall biosynthesis